MRKLVLSFSAAAALAAAGAAFPAAACGPLPIFDETVANEALPEPAPEAAPAADTAATPAADTSKAAAPAPAAKAK